MIKRPDGLDYFANTHHPDHEGWGYDQLWIERQVVSEYARKLEALIDRVIAIAEEAHFTPESERASHMARVLIEKEIK